MRIDAGLSTYLWNEIVRTAGYIANRTPMQEHNWKIPFEKVVGTPPNRHHLRKIEHETYIQCDNMQTIRAFTADTPKFTTKLRHVDIHRHLLRQVVQSKRISIEWTSTTAILADGLTKALPPQRHKEFVRLIGLRRPEGVKTNGS